MALFTVDVEDWHHGLHLPRSWHSSHTALWWLINTLQYYKVRGVFYVLGEFREEYPYVCRVLPNFGHVVKSHGYYHYRDEAADRKPYAWLGFTGGFYFRVFPYWLIKRQVIKNGLFYIHPHDLDEEHPRLLNPFMNWKRRVGLKSARNKLIRLLKEVKWDEPSEN